MDVSISKIMKTYYIKTNQWRRDLAIARYYDGVVFFTEGMIEYDFGDKKITAKPGDILFLPSNLPYSGKKLTETVAFYVIDFECAIKNEFKDVVGALISSTQNYDTLKFKFQEAVELWKMQYIDVNFKIKSFLYNLLSNSVKSKSKTKEGTTYTETILTYISENIKNPNLSVIDLCNKFFISESQLRRNIYKYTGINPNQYILKLRLNLAQTELIYTQKNVNVISQDCGFSSPYYFSKCFSKQFGVSPKTYREQFINS